MAKRLLPPDWHIDRDDRTGPVTDGVIVAKLAGTSIDTPVWFDKDLGTGNTETVDCDATGYPASGGNDVALWGADDVSYDLWVSGTGYNGNATKVLENVAIADSSTVDSAVSALALGNALSNGGFDTWSGATTFSNVSGSGTGAETADGWFLSQSGAASNAASQQAGFAIGADPAAARYCARVGRPAASNSTNAIRFWKTLRPEIVKRLRGQEVALRYSLKKGADFSGGGLTVKLATGTTESESGDLIDGGGFAGNQNRLNQARTISTDGDRFEDDVTLGATDAELGVQFSYVPTGIAGANDWFEVQDVDIKGIDETEAFEGRPEPLEFFVGKLDAGGRLFIQSAFADPNADQIMFWDDSAGAITGLAVSTGLNITGTTITLDQTFSPQWSGTHRFTNTGLTVLDTDASHALTIKPGSNLTGAHVFTLTTGDADRTLDISGGNVTITAAAGTVLDDATVGAMCTTLGAAQLGAANVFTALNEFRADIQLTVGTDQFIYYDGALHFAKNGTGDAVAIDASRNVTISAGDLILASAVAPTSIYSAGYRGSPIINGNSAYAFPTTDAGATIYHDEAGTRTYTIPANASVAHPIGTMFAISNTGNSGSAGTITLAITSDTLRRADGVSGTGSRTIAANQKVVITKVTSTIWEISGTFS